MLAIHFGLTQILAIQKHSNHLLIGACNILTREDCRAEEGGNTYLQHLLCKCLLCKCECSLASSQFILDIDMITSGPLHASLAIYNQYSFNYIVP